MNQQISSFFIRPPRQTYYEHDLGPQMYPLQNKQKLKPKIVTRTDFSVINNRNLKLNSSFYRLKDSSSNKCLIYLHTHHGSRLEALNLIQPIVSVNINVCLFDFCGYGNSQGDTVTLGIRESEDIGDIVECLKNNFQQRMFLLWGRSMGAVASIIYLYKAQLNMTNQSIVGAVFDSPFHSLYKLTLQMGQKNIGIPQAILRPFVFLIKKSLQSQLDFQQLQLQPIAEQLKTPCIFITSKQDKFVSSKHSQKLYQKYSGPKQLIYIERDHNEPRKQDDLSEVFSFIFKKMGIDQKGHENGDKINGYLNLISRHFKFIQNNQNHLQQNERLKGYFRLNKVKNSEQEQSGPLTLRLQYDSYKQAPRDIFSARHSPNSKEEKQKKIISYFNKSQKIPKGKQATK